MFLFHLYFMNGWVDFDCFIFIVTVNYPFLILLNILIYSAKDFSNSIELLRCHFPYHIWKLTYWCKLDHRLTVDKFLAMAIRKPKFNETLHARRTISRMNVCQFLLKPKFCFPAIREQVIKIGQHFIQNVLLFKY